jgi:hypothetical protein
MIHLQGIKGNTLCYSSSFLEQFQKNMQTLTIRYLIIPRTNTNLMGNMD